MNQLSDRLNSLSPSATLAMSQKSAELKAQGVDVINLSVGEPDFNTPDHIKEAAKQAIDENYSRYSPVAGYPALRNAIVAKLKTKTVWTIPLPRFRVPMVLSNRCATLFWHLSIRVMKSLFLLLTGLAIRRW